MTHLLRALIREALLTEEVYGAQATVYHGTHTDPRILIPEILNDKFEPGKGSGSMYGKGLYTVYDPSKSKYDKTPAQTMTGAYGQYVIKLKVNLYGFIIFDPEIAIKVYGQKLSLAQQAKKIGIDANLIEKLKKIDEVRRYFSSSEAAEKASKFIEGRVKGLVFTGNNDGRVAVIYDPSTAIPMSWKSIRDKDWTQVDKESIKLALKKSTSKDWEEEKYINNLLKMLRSLKKLPLHQRIVKGDLIIPNTGSSLSGLQSGETDIDSLPNGLQVERDLMLTNSSIKFLPANLKVGRHVFLSMTNITSLPASFNKIKGDLSLTYSQIKVLPDNLEVEGNLELSNSRHIYALPSNLKVGDSLYISDTKISSLPQGLNVKQHLFASRSALASIPPDITVGGYIELTDTPIRSLPENLKVAKSLYLRNTNVSVLPNGLQVNEDLHLDYKVKNLPADLKVGRHIYGFTGDKSKVPEHLKGKLK